MRKLVFLMGLFLLGSCSSGDETYDQKTIEVEDIGGLEFEYTDMDVYHIQEIDGCEYILVNGMDNREPALTHKGNCKYCLERNKQRVIEVNEKDEY